MKKILAILCVFAMSTAMLAGCSGGSSAPETQATEAPATEAPATEVPDEAQEDTQTAEPDAEPAEDIELHISAAASLTDVIDELIAEYKELAPNVTLVPTYDSSGTLQTQIEEGAPADVFISAAQKQMDSLEQQELIDTASRLDLLLNKVVLIVPKDSESDIASFEDVATDKVSMVAIGNDTVPVGQYTQEIYTSLGLWDEVSAKANLGENVRAVLSWVESGDVDCGIVYATDAASTENVTVICEAPEDSHLPVIYPAAVLAGSENSEAAGDFLDFLSSDTAVAAFEKAGFTMA